MITNGIESVLKWYYLHKLSIIFIKSNGFWRTEFLGHWWILRRITPLKKFFLKELLKFSIFILFSSGTEMPSQISSASCSSKGSTLSMAQSWCELSVSSGQCSSQSNDGKSSLFEEENNHVGLCVQFMYSMFSPYFML